MEYKFYQSYLKLLEEDYEFRQATLSDFQKKLRHAKFRKFVIESQGRNYNTILNIRNVMRMGILRPQRLLLDHSNFYMACDMITNTYYLCFKNLMMIDIDFYKESGSGKDEIIKMFEENVNKTPGNVWHLFQTKGGVHAFLVSRSIGYFERESCDMMIELNCDFNYVVYSHLRGWCVRLNRKKKEDSMVNIDLGTIGNSKLISDDLNRLINLHVRMINVFKEEEPCSMYGV